MGKDINCEIRHGKLWSFAVDEEVIALVNRQNEISNMASLES